MRSPLFWQMVLANVVGCLLAGALAIVAALLVLPVAAEASPRSLPPLAPPKAVVAPWATGGLEVRIGVIDNEHIRATLRCQEQTGLVAKDSPYWEVWRMFMLEHITVDQLAAALPEDPLATCVVADLGGGS